MRRLGGMFATLVVAVLVLPATAAAQQVQGLRATQGEGFATLAWEPVAGATDYQIERTPVDPVNLPTGPSVITGVWQPLRTITPDRPRFADAGFELGGRYMWRVRARIGAEAQPFSEAVFGNTRPQWGSGPGAGLRTQWESSGNATYTSDVNEYAYTAALDNSSPRVRVVEIGRTNPVPTAPEGRPINLLILGYPAPPATAQAISDRPAIVYNCNVHGNEPQGRESCLIFARMLAFTEDEALLDVLRDLTVLIVPSINGNGRAANTRGNETGQDLNRDYALIEQPETKAFVRMLRDYTPEAGIDLHEGDTEDLPILTSRHLNVFEPILREGKEELVEGWMYTAASRSGWWMGPYSNGGDSHEGILRNTYGLKNVVGMLAENRSGGGATRPAETGNQLANRNRKSYGSLWEEFQALDYYWTRQPQIEEMVESSVAFQRTNTGPVILRGSYPWPLDPRFPAHPLPDTDAPTPERTLDPAPCGYFLTEAQFSGDMFGGSVGSRLAIHGITQQDRPAGHVVRLFGQAQRGLIPTLLDPDAVAPEPMIEGTRLNECPHIESPTRSIEASAVEDTETTATLTIRNLAVEADEPLDWTITESVSDCATPTDLPWVTASQTTGTTSSRGGSSDVELTFSAADIDAPDRGSGVLCVSSNDSGEPVMVVALDLEVRNLRFELEDLADALADRRPLAKRADDRRLRDAVRELDRATRERRWEGGGHLGRNGAAVFDRSRFAVRELEHIARFPDWVEEAIDEMVAINRTLAQIAVDEAPDGPDRELAQAFLDEGDALAADGEHRRAIRRYRRAWARANRPSKHGGESAGADSLASSLREHRGEVAL
jgi:zinc carboxypeptidase